MPGHCAAREVTSSRDAGSRTSLFCFATHEWQQQDAQNRNGSMKQSIHVREHFSYPRLRSNACRFLEAVFFFLWGFAAGTTKAAMIQLRSIRRVASVYLL